MSFALGSYSFSNWRGKPPQLRKQHIELFAKPGCTDVGAVATGTHGDPFEFETVEYFSSQANQLTAAAGYRALIGAAAQVVVYAGVDYHTSHSHKYLVLNVEPVSLQPIPAVYGNVNLTPAWPVTAKWRLIGVSAS